MRPTPGCISTSLTSLHRPTGLLPRNSGSCRHPTSLKRGHTPFRSKQTMGPSFPSLYSDTKFGCPKNNSLPPHYTNYSLCFPILQTKESESEITVCRKPGKTLLTFPEWSQHPLASPTNYVTNEKWDKTWNRWKKLKREVGEKTHRIPE